MMVPHAPALRTTSGGSLNMPEDMSSVARIVLDVVHLRLGWLVTIWPLHLVAPGRSHDGVL